MSRYKLLKMSLDPKLPGRIKEIREKTNMKQKEFATVIQCSPSYLSDIEHGRVKPSLELIVKICQKFSIHADWLLLGKNNGDISMATLKDILSHKGLYSIEDIECFFEVLESYLGKDLYSSFIYLYKVRRRYIKNATELLVS